MSHFNKTLIFLDRFSKSTQTPNFSKIRPVAAQLFHADGRTDGLTDMMKLIVAFRSFANAPKTQCQNILKQNRPVAGGGEGDLTVSTVGSLFTTR